MATKLVFNPLTGNFDLVQDVSGLVSGSGTINTIPKFTAAGAIGNSSRTDTGTVVTETLAVTLANLTNALNSGNYALQMKSGVADGPSAVGFQFDTTNNLTNATAKGFSVKINGTEDFYIGNNRASVGRNPSATKGYSFGAGNYTSGDMATAIGSDNYPSGNYSTTIGISNLASAYGSIAIGDSNTVVGEVAFSAGAINNISSGGAYATALGYNNTVSASYSIALGVGMNITGANSTGVGANHTLSQLGTFAAGSGNRVSGLYSSAFGQGTVTSGNWSISMGASSQATGNYAFAGGVQALASGTGSFAWGQLSTASGQDSFTIGTINSARGASSIVLGNFSSANGSNAYAIGFVTVAGVSNSIALGSYVRNGITDSFAYGSAVNTTFPAISVSHGRTLMNNNRVLIGKSTTLDGTELVTNGTFTGGITSWTAGTGWAYGTNNIIKSVNASSGTLTQTISGLVVGQVYRLSYVITSASGGSDVTPENLSVAVSGAGQAMNTIIANGTWTELFVATATSGTLTFTPTNNFAFTLDTVSIQRVTGGNLSVAGTIYPTGGTTTVTPIILTTPDALNTTPVSGGIERSVAGDDMHFTIATGAARKTFTLSDIALTATRVPFATTNGRLTDDADFTFVTDTLTATKIVGTTSVKVGTAAGYISSDGSTGATGTFTTADLKTVTVKDGIITSIV